MKQSAAIIGLILLVLFGLYSAASAVGLTDVMPAIDIVIEVTVVILFFGLAAVGAVHYWKRGRRTRR